MTTKPSRGLVGRVEAAEAATTEQPPDEATILARLTDHELDLLEAALLAGDAHAAAEITAQAEQRVAVGAPPWMDTEAAAQARAAERAWYWRLLPTVLAEQQRTGRPVDYEALEREARRRAEEDRG